MDERNIKKKEGVDESQYAEWNDRRQQSNASSSQ